MTNKMTNKYHKKHKESLQKGARERYKSFSEEEKNKSQYYRERNNIFPEE